jgi:hypothetical protein
MTTSKPQSLPLSPETPEARLLDAVASLMEALRTLTGDPAARAISLLHPFEIRGVDPLYVDQLSASLSRGLEEQNWSSAEAGYLASHLREVDDCIARIKPRM